MEPTTELYFEAHITIEPVFGGELEFLAEIVSRNGFRVADLLMKKRKGDTPERSQYDTFCTARSKTYSDIYARSRACVAELRFYGYGVWRMKIENTLLDEHYEL